MVPVRSLSVTRLAFDPKSRPLLRVLASRPGLVVVRGHPESSRLAHSFLAAPLLRGETVLFLDAANCFNPYRLTAFARRCWRAPEEFLERVLVSRAFTCFQLAELIERTPAAVLRYRARRIFLTGFPDIFDDEELAAAEVRQVFRRILTRLRSWPQQSLTALLFSAADSRGSPLRRWLERELARTATAVYRLEESPAGLALCEEKRPTSVGQDFLPARTGLCGDKRPRRLSGTRLGAANRRDAEDAEKNAEASRGGESWVAPSPLFIS